MDFLLNGMFGPDMVGLTILFWALMPIFLIIYGIAALIRKVKR